MELKSKELVDVIDACGKNGVSQIKLGDIEITFNGFVKVLESDYPEFAAKVGNTVVADPNFQYQQDLESGYQDDEELLILDPAAYEDKLLKGELENNQD